MGRKSTPGLYKRGRFWHIRKTIYGEEVSQSTKCENLEDAEEVLRQVTQEIKLSSSQTERPERTFDDAVQKYIAEATKKTIVDDCYHLKRLKPFIGHLPLDKIHMGILKPFIESEQGRGVKARTVNHALQVVRRVLNLASGDWFHGNGLNWLQGVPKIKFQPEKDRRKPYPLSWDEQRRLFTELPEHVLRMALFKVNTGTREAEVCTLKWEWEIKVPDLNTTIFQIPAERVKNRDDRIVVLNTTARSVIESVRGKHPVYVFTYMGRPVAKLNSRAWRRARKRAGLEQVRVHDLKHTWGYRLRLAGVPEEDRKDLLGHRSGKSMTMHYSAADLAKLMEYANKVVETERTPSLIVLGRATA